MKIKVKDESTEATTLEFNRCHHCNKLNSYWWSYCSDHENIIDTQVEREEDGGREY